MKDFHSPACKRARAAYTVQCAFQYFVTLLAADAFLAKDVGDFVTRVLSLFRGEQDTYCSTYDGTAKKCYQKIH